MTTRVCIAADADQFPFAPKTGFSVDVSVIDRMNGRSAFAACAHTTMLDHHATNAGSGDVYFVDGGAAACGELAVELMDALGAALDPIAATWLFIAIATDCGRFGYGSTRPETLIAAAACLRTGIDVDGITRSVFLTRTEGRTQLLGLVLAGLKRSEDGKICWARLTEDMLAKAGAVREDNEGIVNYLVEIEGVQAACLAEQRGAQTKLSLRAVRVGRYCARRRHAAGRRRTRERRGRDDERFHGSRAEDRALPDAQYAQSGGGMPMNGFLIANKPTGITSSNLVVFVRKRLPRGTSVGRSAARWIPKHRAFCRSASVRRRACLILSSIKRKPTSPKFAWAKSQIRRTRRGRSLKRAK